MKFVLPTLNEWHSLHPEQTRDSSSNFSFIIDYLPILTGYLVKKKKKKKKKRKRKEEGETLTEIVILKLGMV